MPTRIGKPLLVEMHACAAKFGIQSPGEQRGQGAELRRLGGSVFDQIEHGRPSDKEKNPRPGTRVAGMTTGA
ncbi:hypothetical protein [Caballeronia temeraria]|uniref:hypothetical protein n=1 Tax=Caballeronia temeraria TaxID=1777137 RepID=UPI0012FDFF09|nr:hypothetical protein [Caballeronia temeraria]